MRTPDEQKAYNREKTARYRARQGREAMNAQARAAYHQHDDEPERAQKERERRNARGRRNYYANVTHNRTRKAKTQAVRTAIRAEDPMLAERNRASRNKATARWRQRHPEKQKAATDTWRAAHPDHINATRRARYAKDPTKPLEHNRKRYALRRGANGSTLTREQWDTIKAHYNFRCVYCEPTCWRCIRKCHALTQDHLTPVSGGGPDTLQNVVPACRTHNSQKGTGKVLRPVQPMLL
jgi:hypothetical protein